MSKYYFDKKAAEKAIGFIETFVTHTKGELTGQPLKLEKWQSKIVGDIFGWKNKETNLRKYRTVFIEVPRKNGKSTLCAAIGLYMLFADEERGSEVYSAAGDRSQAGIVQEEYVSIIATILLSAMTTGMVGVIISSAITMISIGMVQIVMLSLLR